MRPSLLVLLFAATTACSSIATEFGGQSVSQRGGHLYVDDVSLDYHREVGVSGTLAAGSLLSLASATGSVVVSGVPGDTYDLVVELYSEFEGDGEVYLADDGHLRTRSERDGRTLVESVHGTVPLGVALRVATGTGKVSVAGLSSESSLDVDTGTGSLDVSHCVLGGLSIDTGTGSLTLDDCRFDTLRVRSGAGDVLASDCRVARFTGSLGTSDVRLRGSLIDSLELTSATGDLLLVDSTVGSQQLSLGTGSVIIKDSASAARP